MRRPEKPDVMLCLPRSQEKVSEKSQILSVEPPGTLFAPPANEKSPLNWRFGKDAPDWLYVLLSPKAEMSALGAATPDDRLLYASQPNNAWFKRCAPKVWVSPTTQVCVVTAAIAF